MTRRESPLVNACLQLLKLRGIAATRHHCGEVHRPAGPGTRPIHMNLGPAGWPDIIGYLPNGQFMGIEVKVGKNVPSAEQQERLDSICEAGGAWAVIYSVAGLEAWLEQQEISRWTPGWRSAGA